jgi:integrase
VKVVEVGNKYRIIVPPRITGGNRKVQFFDTKTEAQVAARKIEKFGLDSTSELAEDDLALLKFFKKRYGNDAAEILRRLDLAEKFVDAVPKEKQIPLYDVCIAYVDHHRQIGSNIRTIAKYRVMGERLREEFGLNTQLPAITRDQIEGWILKTWSHPGTRRAQYANIKAFLNWALSHRYIAVDPMANSKPIGKWGVKNKPLRPDEFRRILFVVAALEPITPGEAPTTRYIRLLPFYVLGGLAGMRRCEIISSYKNDPVIQWEDIEWKKNHIHIRPEVAKQTDAQEKRRYIPIEPAAAEWLSLIPEKERTGPVMTISQSTLQRLNQELLHLLDIDPPDNGLRNGYATWGATFRPIGELAMATGDLEQTLKRFYVERREPETGRAWFNIRPSERKIVPMKVEAA